MVAGGGGGGSGSSGGGYHLGRLDPIQSTTPQRMVVNQNCYFERYDPTD